jgi:hypothetical protein
MKDSGQLTFTTMGGETVTVRARGKHYVQQRGYAAPPGTGPEGETCGSCEHCVRGREGRYRKCELNRARWTHGPGSDILARSLACSKWTAAQQ